MSAILLLLNTKGSEYVPTGVVEANLTKIWVALIVPELLSMVSILLKLILSVLISNPSGAVKFNADVSQLPEMEKDVVIEGVP